MEEEALSSRLNTSEKLLIAQAVYKFGALDWDKISGLLANHPVIEGRPTEWFDTKTCEAYYVGLMTEAGINVPAQDAARPQAKVHLRLAQKYYLARLQEVKSAIAAYEQKFTTLMSEIASIKSGGMDKAIRDDIRAVLARKFGKRLLDSWVPDEDAVKAAVAAGPPAAEEDAKVEHPNEEASKAGEEPAGLSTTEEAKVETVEEPVEKPAEESAEVAEPTPIEPATPTAVPQAEQEDVEMAESSPRQFSPTKGRVATPGPPTNPPTSSPSQAAHAQPSAPSTPASDFTPPPDDKAGQPSPSKLKDEAAPSCSTRTSKRKASTQPRGAPTTKRSTRRRTSATPAAPEAEPSPEAGDADPEPEPEVEAAEAKEQAIPSAVKGETEPANVDDKPGEVQESETVEEDAPQTRGRRATKRDSTAGGRTKKPTSPASSSRHLSPPAAKRGTSASSVKSPTPVEERRSSRRGGQKGRGMRDEVVSKSVREQSAAVESVKEEDEAEQERPPTRSSRRAKDNTTPVPDISAPLPDQRKGTRRSSTRAGGLQADTEDEKPQVDEEDKDKKQPRRPRLSSPRESKNTRKMLFGLLDQISGHRNGNVFAQPIKQKELPEYYDVIKRPMDLKKIRQRIRDSQITTIDEFERDVMLMFANATMFNAKGSSTHDMAIEMMKDAEAHIQHFKTVQHHMGR